MLLAEVIKHKLGAARDEPVLRTEQPHIVMLPDVVVQADVIGIPILAERTDVHGLELVPPISAVMGAPCEGPLRVQTPQPHKTGMPKAVRVVITDHRTIGALVHQHDFLDRGVSPVRKPAGSSAWQGSLPAVIVTGEALYSLPLQVFLPICFLIDHTGGDAAGLYHGVEIGPVAIQVDTVYRGQRRLVISVIYQQW